MSEIIKNGGLDQHGAGPFKPQQFGTDGVEGVKVVMYIKISWRFCSVLSADVKLTAPMFYSACNCLYNHVSCLPGVVLLQLSQS